MSAGLRLRFYLLAATCAPLGLACFGLRFGSGRRVGGPPRALRGPRPRRWDLPFPAVGRAAKFRGVPSKLIAMKPGRCSPMADYAGPPLPCATVAATPIAGAATAVRFSRSGSRERAVRRRVWCASAVRVAGRSRPRFGRLFGGRFAGASAVSRGPLRRYARSAAAACCCAPDSHLRVALSFVRGAVRPPGAPRSIRYGGSSFDRLSMAPKIFSRSEGNGDRRSATPRNVRAPGAHRCGWT